MKKNKGYISIIAAGVIGLIALASVGAALNNGESLNVAGNSNVLMMQNFLALSDTPNSYSGQGGKVVQVNAGATALEFAAAGGGAPTTADYLVGTANGSLSAEIVVGTSPGGELGNTWASPTLDDGLTVDGWTITGATLTASGLITGNANLNIANGATSSGILKILEDTDDGSNFATFQVPALAANTAYTLPPDDGDAGEQLQTNGSGVLTWEAAGSASATAWNDIGDAAGAGSVDFGGHDQDIISSEDGGDILTISNTDADNASDSSVLILAANDDADANTFFIKAINDADGTPTTIFALQPSTTTTAGKILLGATGVILEDDADGALTITGNGAGSDESLTFNFDDAANEVGVSTGSGVTTINFGSITLTAGLVGNASTATALAANPADCSANQFAISIVAAGTLTCAAIADADVPNNITIDLATLASTVTVVDGTDATSFPAIFDSVTGSLAIKTDAGLTYDASNSTLAATTFSGALSGNATTATALAGNPTDCGANEFAHTIAASGNLTCSALTLASAQFANQGTTTTVLHGNAAGNPSWGAIVSADITDGTITAADTALTAGRSLTFSTNDILADAELYTDSKCIWFDNPTASDDLKSIWRAKQAATLTSLWAESDQTVTFMLQVDDGTPADIDSVDLAPAAGEAEDTSLNGDTTMASGDRLDIDLVSVASTPTWVSICWTFTYDD